MRKIGSGIYVYLKNEKHAGPFHQARGKLLPMPPADIIHLKYA